MKFRLREKLKYMFLEGLLTLAGFMIRNMNSNTEAQFGSETFDKLTVRELIVRKDITVMSEGWILGFISLGTERVDVW